MAFDQPTSNCCSSAEDGTKTRIMVIGAGSAGFSAAITAADAGSAVTLVGDGTIGGTCVNIGCVPSKAMIRAVEPLHQAREAKRFSGIASHAEITDWAALVAQKQHLVDELRQAKYSDVLPSHPNVDYIEGRAKLVDGGVMVGDMLHTPDKIIIATGSSNSVPPIPGIDTVDYLDSTRALELETLPKSMIIIGAGVIGCELGQMFARAGVQVHLCCRSRLLPHMEPEISDHLKAALTAEGIAVYCGLDYQQLGQVGGHIKLTSHQNGLTVTLDAETLLVATGRTPNTAGMGLEDVGVSLTPKGGIIVDQNMRSSVPTIFAAGDVTGDDMFVYMAAYGARLAATAATAQDCCDTEAYSNDTMPEVVFCDPQAATVGLTENTAQSAGYNVKTSILTLDHVPRYLAARDTRGVIKLVADRDTDALLGAHILAPEGGELIQTAVMAIKSGMTTKALAATVFPYLTGVEGLKLAAQTFDKDVSTLSCCAG